MFRVGDRVRCIDNNAFEDTLAVGKTYIIHQVVRKNAHATWVRVRDLRKFILPHEYMPKRFVLVPDHKFVDPVETIPAKRVLKSGVYGKLRVQHDTDDRVRLGLYGLDGGLVGCNVEDLDELIFTLVQVREFLKDG